MRYLPMLAVFVAACAQTPHHEATATAETNDPMPERSLAVTVEAFPLPQTEAEVPQTQPGAVLVPAHDTKPETVAEAPPEAPRATPPDPPESDAPEPATAPESPEPAPAEPGVRERMATLLLAGDGESLARAEALLPELEAEPGVSENWLRLVRALIAEAAGEPAEVAAHARAAWLHSLAQVPMRIGASHIADDIGTSEARDSISFRPEAYVSTAFQASHFGVRQRQDGRWDFHLKVSARLLDEEGREVAGFNPPDAEYSPDRPGSVPCNGPAEQPTWFVYELQQPLPRDLRAGNYVVELTVTDLWKPATKPQQIRLDIRVR